MKKTIILALTLLLLIGCRHNRAVSPRLVELDSLIAVAPDSAAALLEAIPSDSLTDPENRAYHALLLTQAKYKADIHAFCLDTINLAVSHYSDGHDIEKQTRSILYKGCIFEELPQPDSALYYFKAAEDLAAQSGDIYNRGYAFMRMAWLYQEQNSGETNIHAINKYRRAIDLLNQANAVDKQLACMLEVSSLYYPIKPDSALVFVEKVRQKALSIADSASILTAMRINAQILLDLNKYEESKSLAMTVISHATDPADRYNSFLIASQAFSHMGQIDSAEFCLACAEQPTSKRDSVVMYRAKAELMQEKDDLQNYILYSEKAVNMAGDLEKHAYRCGLDVFEKKIDKQYEKARLEKQRVSSVRIILLALFLCSLLAIVVVLIQKRRSETEQMAKELQSDLMKLQTEFDNMKVESQHKMSMMDTKLRNGDHEKEELQKQLQQECDTNAKLKLSLRVLNEELKSVIDISSPDYKPSHLSEWIELFVTFVNKCNSKKQKNRQVANLVNIEIFSDEMLSFLREYIDLKYPKLVEIISSAEYSLSERDINIACMHFAGYSNATIKAYMNATNEHSVTTRKRIIAKQILHNSARIDDLLTAF